MEQMKTCADFADESDFPGCCDSCHEDYEAGYDCMDQSANYSVCCVVALWLIKDCGIDIYK
jgi:hypothetical protein